MSRQDKQDRALALFEKGVDIPAICDRLGVAGKQHVYTMIKRARERREKAKGEVNA